jgi:hypothetical protein
MVTRRQFLRAAKAMATVGGREKPFEPMKGRPINLTAQGGLCEHGRAQLTQVLELDCVEPGEGPRHE